MHEIRYKNASYVAQKISDYVLQSINKGHYLHWDGLCPKFLQKTMTPITSYTADVPKMENGNEPWIVSVSEM